MFSPQRLSAFLVASLSVFALHLDTVGGTLFSADYPYYPEQSLRQELGAVDSSGRNAVVAELAAMQPCCSHHLPGQEIPEKNWSYRLAKKFWFFGFGAYG